MKVCRIKPFINGYLPILIEHRAQTWRLHCLLQPYRRVQATMAGHSSVMLGWSWTDLSVLGSQFFGPGTYIKIVVFQFALYHILYHINIFKTTKQCQLNIIPSKYIVKKWHYILKIRIKFHFFNSSLCIIKYFCPCQVSISWGCFLGEESCLRFWEILTKYSMGIFRWKLSKVENKKSNYNHDKYTHKPLPIHVVKQPTV